METVSFKQMSRGTAEEYAYLAKLEKDYVSELPARLMEALKGLENSLSGYLVSRLEHSLQSATHAYNANEPEEMVVAALLHDAGGDLGGFFWA